MVSNQKLDETLKVLNKIKLKKEGVATPSFFNLILFKTLSISSSFSFETIIQAPLVQIEL